MDVFSQLQAGRDTVANIPDRAEPGVYAIFAKDRDCRPSIFVPQSEIVYIGQSGNLDQRNHFKAKHSGFHSPRRSFGAILKDHLRLEINPRGTGTSKTNYRCFRFTAEGEERLTQWMRSNLEYAIHPYSSDTDALEADLIREAEPPINLTDWANPQKGRIQSLRTSCAQGAKAIWSKRV
jgi:hypothetical protein